jgi:hypothetical protein
MNSRYARTKDRYTNLRKRFRAASAAGCRRAILMTTLVLALVVQSTSVIVPARAQNDWQYLVDILNFPPETLCVRQSTDYLVHIVPKGSIGLGDQHGNVSMELFAGTTVAGVVADSSIADLTPIHGMSTNNPDPSLRRPGIITFALKAKKAGRTTITFSADVVEFGSTFKAHPYTVDVNVQECAFKVTIKSHWQVPGLGYAAIIDEADLKPDAAGNYTGTAKVTWSGWWDVIPAGINTGITCTTKLTAPPSQAYLTGKMSESGFLEVNVTYRSNPSSWSAVCRDTSGATPPSITPGMLTPDSLKISIPVAIGGVSTQPQALIDQIDASAGSAFIDISPDTTRQQP